MKGQGSLASLGDFPGNVDDLTPEWLTQAFRAHGLDVTVASFVAKQIGTGQVGENNRIVLTYEGEAKGAPKTVVCKFSSRDPQSRATGMNSRNYIKEWRFYTHLAPYLRERGVNVAQCWAAEFDPDRAETILVLEVRWVLPRFFPRKMLRMTSFFH